MIIKLELRTEENGARFLNFWDAAHGHDVTCEVQDNGDLYAWDGDEYADKITLDEFLTLCIRESEDA
jgi:hypothetical protein